ncbi:MAG: universal stress protein [Thermodesulfobacteriota bacterium]|nr:universal stress protein [Thermodesulfobacteriota bacterium]
MKAIGLCSYFSKQGDWAFELAFRIARNKNLQLNIFHFLESPFRFRREYVYKDESKEELVHVAPELIVKKERELREYYEDKLGDFVDVGFRICERNEIFEVKKCLFRKEYDVLIMGYHDIGAHFGGEPVEKFANEIKVATILVGPQKPDSYYLNDRAVPLADELGLPKGSWKRITDS